jgi:hypothetical protein
MKNQNQLFYQSKAIVYSFDNKNNLTPLLSKIEYLLKMFFLSICCLISRPVYLIKHDKVIIRLFVFLSPKVNSFIISTVRIGGGSQALPVVNKALMAEVLKLKNKLHRNKIVHIKMKQYLENLINGGNNLAVFSTIPPSDKTRTNNQDSRKSFLELFKHDLKKISLILGKIINKKVELEIIKIHYPFHDSNLLAQILGINASKYNFKRLLKKLIPRAAVKNPSISYSILSDEERRAKRFRVSKPDSYLPDFFKVNINNLNQFVSMSLQRLNMDNPSIISTGTKTDQSIYNDINISISKTNTLTKKTVNKSDAGNNQIKSLLISNLLSKYKSLTASTGSENKYSKFENTLFNSYLSGLNVRLGGRLITEGLRPRFTVKSKQTGTLARVKVQSIEKSRFTGKNKRGAFSFTVTISHVYND